MAYSANALAKFRTKPIWMSNNDESSVYATDAGWEMAHPNGTKELLVTIPNLSKILEEDTSGGVDATKAVIMYLSSDSFGYVRRSRKRYIFQVSFQEELTTTASTTFTLNLNGANCVATDVSGSSIVADLTGSSGLSVVHASGETLGRVQFDVTFSDVVGELHVALAATPLTVTSIGNLTDAQGHVMSSIDFTSLASYAIDVVG